MKTLLGRVRSTIEDEGLVYTLRSAVRFLHRRYIRKFLPRRTTTLNGVNVRSARLFDSVLPWQLGRQDAENYESAIVNNLRTFVQTGDKIVIVGGGWGVSTVVAAEETGESGSVRTFEASPTYATYIEETTKLNDVHDRVKITNAVVSRVISTRGDESSDTVIPPEKLPETDVLELDCEGAELEILRNMSIRPRAIIVETHGKFGSPSSKVIESLEDLSYGVVSKEPAEKGAKEEKCITNDIHVLVALRR